MAGRIGRRGARAVVERPVRDQALEERAGRQLDDIDCRRLATGESRAGDRGSPSKLHSHATSVRLPMTVGRFERATVSLKN